MTVEERATRLVLALTTGDAPPDAYAECEKHIRAAVEEAVAVERERIAAKVEKALKQWERADLKDLPAAIRGAK